ncbi:MAG: Lrp/AsnC family transcriptional regulator [Thermosphaera sp.]
MTSQLNYELSDEDLRILRHILRNSDKPLYQSEIWKELKLDSRAASRSLQKLESIGIIRRKEAVVNGRKTFLIEPDTEKINQVLVARKSAKSESGLEEVLDVVCVSCPFIYRCYQGGYYDPTTCTWLSDYIRKLVRELGPQLKAL